MSGDFAYFIGSRIIINFIIINIFLISILSQLINYYNYRNGIKATDLRVFQMISGLITPKSIGITDKQLIYKLIKRFKFSINLCEYII